MPHFADTLPGMWDWFLDDPAGWLSLLLALLVVLFSAIFWRKTWAVAKAIGRVFRAVGRWIATRRVVSVDRLPAKGPIPPVRWDIVKLRDSARDEYALANFGEGSIARDVKLDSFEPDFMLRSSALWPAIDGGNVGRFRAALRGDPFFMGVSLWIEWTDANGKRQHQQLFKRSE